MCGARTAPLHGRISCSNRDKHNSKCSYSCDSGYELIGSDETDCQADGDWSYPSPKCVKVSCGPLVAPENGRLECSGTDALFGTECEAICNEGFKLTSGSKTRKCLPDTTWSGVPAQCTQIVCTLLDSPEHGRRLCSNANIYGSRCRFACQVGYDFVGTEIRVCQENGSWSGELAKCSIKARFIVFLTRTIKITIFFSNN